jgi:DNA-binding PadR family transcriptional regulator
MSRGEIMSAEKSEVLRGTLDPMIVKTLHALGLQHGFGNARRIEQISEQVLKLNEETVYTSLLPLRQQGWIDSDWGDQRTTGRPSSTRSPSAGLNSWRLKRRIGKQFPA